MDMYCKNCGNKLNDYDKFCMKCETKIEIQKLQLNNVNLKKNNKLTKILGLCVGVLLVFLMTGCLSNDQRKEKEKIEKEVKPIMLDYLRDNYNVNEIYDVEAEYTLTGDIADSQFKGIVTANFKNEGQVYQILYDYDEKKCYDSFAYLKKVNPILTNYIKSILDKYSTYDINKPNYVVLRNDYYDYNNSNSYGFFNNYDKVNAYEDVISYYDVKATSIEIIYNTSNNIIEKNINIFEKISKEINNRIEVNVYNQGVIKEHFYDDMESDYNYYMNEILKIGDFTAYWHVKDISLDGHGKNEQGDFKISLADNNYFDKEIELYGSEYLLYSNKILLVEDISDNTDLHYLYLELNDEVCDSKSVIVYKDELGNEKDLIKSVSFEPGAYETKKFAIYCRKKI